MTNKQNTRPVEMKRRTTICSVGVLAVCSALVGFVSCSQQPSQTSQTAESTNAVTATVAAVSNVSPAAVTNSAPKLYKLLGRWIRPDGGYVLEISNVEDNGRMDAKYFNPDPIHISRAAASQIDGKISAFVELQDQNYPGCTYKLEYVPDNDTLQGVYFQAALQESYEVAFEREPKH